MIIPISPIDLLISDANRNLDFRLAIFSKRLDIQMTLLEYGPDYLDSLLDKIIQEISGEGVVGNEES